MNTDYARTTSKDLWHTNSGLVLLLGVCPSLAICNSIVNAVGLALVMLVVLTISNFLVSLCRQQLVPTLHLPASVMLIAALTTCADLIMQAWAYELHQALGIYLPLIATNCLLFGRADAFASKHDPRAAAVDGLRLGSGLLLVLVIIGAARELLGTGALFANMQQLLPFAGSWYLQLFDTETPFLLALLPPGAFLVLGGLLALKNVVNSPLAPPAATTTDVVAGSKRARVTGHIQ